MVGHTLSSGSAYTPYKDQHSSKLKHYLYENMPNVSSLDVIDKKSVKRYKFDVEMGILGASHYISVRCGGATTTEVLACADMGMDGCVSATKSPKLVVLNLGKDGTKYSLASEFISFEDKFMKLVPQHMKQYTPSEYFGNMLSGQYVDQNKDVFYLSHEFASDPQCRWPTHTIIKVAIKPQSVDVETIHAYQEEQGYVATRSTIEVL